MECLTNVTRRNGFLLAQSLRGQFSILGKSQQQECATADHTVSTARMLKGCLLVLSSLSPFYSVPDVSPETVLSAFRGVFSLRLKQSRNPLTDMPRFSPIKLVINMNHYRNFLKVLNQFGNLFQGACWKRLGLTSRWHELGRCEHHSELCLSLKPLGHYPASLPPSLPGLFFWSCCTRWGGKATSPTPFIFKQLHY